MVALLLFVVALAGCQVIIETPTPAPAGTAVAQGAAAELAVNALPAGAQVAIDGRPAGVSPLTVTLPAGQHLVAVSADGYAPVSATLTLTAGLRGIYTPDLTGAAQPAVRLWADQTTVPWLGQTQVHAQATDSITVTEMQLLLDGALLAAVEGDEITVTLAPAEVEGLAPGNQYVLSARVADADGNSAESTLPITVGPAPATSTPATAGPAGKGTPARAAPTSATGQVTVVPTTTAAPPGEPPPPTATPEPTDTPPPAQRTVVSSTLNVTSISIPTYPFAAYLGSATDPNVADYPVSVLNRQAYEAANAQPVAQSYTLLVLENQYLRVSLLPDLGGRVYEVIYKPTGHNEFYRNPVIKPTKWGPGAPGHPEGANWWVAAGGMEWGFPVEEHGYEWGTKWGYEPVSLPDGSVMVTLFTRDWQRPYAVVDVILPPDSAAFIVRPRITNPLGSAFRFKWWSDAMLAPGGRNAPGADLRFIFPAGQVTVHSAANGALQPGQALAWPSVNGADLSRLGNWDGWLGFFARPAAAADYMGVYDTAADEGVMRVFPSATARGAKIFAAGWRSPIASSEWTDDGSGYVELHGGLEPTFDDWHTLGPGEVVTWSETWYPVAGIGDVTYANAVAALNVARTDAGVRVRLFPTRPLAGRLEVTLPGAAAVTRAVDSAPGKPFAVEIGGAVGSGPVKVALSDESGQVVLSYSK